MLGNIVHSIDDFLYFFRDTVFLMVIFTAVFKKRILQNNCILYAVTTTVSGIAWRQIYFFLLKLLTDRGSIRRPDDVFPLQEGTPNIRPLMLLIFAVFMGCLLTKATLSHLVILALFYIPVSGQLHPLSYTISYLWPADLLPGWNMIYVIRALCILVLSVLLTWILIKLGRLLIKITDPFFLCLITVCAIGLNIADIYLGAIMNSMFILNITYTLLVIISLLIFLLIGESSRHQAENQRLLFQQEIENSYRNYIFELEEMSQQIRLFRHEYQGKLLLMKTLLKKQDYQTLDQELQDMLEDIPTAEQLVTSGNYDFDVIVNRKLAEIKAHNIPIQVHISVPKELPYSTEDLFSLINNIMNNALEAARETPAPRIFFNAKTQKNYFILTVQNSSSGNVLEDNPDLKTTKSNPSYHGYGIRLIRQIAEKYNGAADFSATKESFICRVMLTLDGVDEEKNTPV